MSLLTNSSVRLAGIAACVPEHIEYNSAFELLNTQERDLLIKTTGIRERRVAKSGTCTSDLCYQAAIELLDELNWSRDEVDLLLFVTQTPDYITPATSAVLQDRLGLKTGLIAFDINLGCSGYVYGLSVAASMMQSGQIKKALLLVGDISTACISDKDKSTAPIFSDAGTATALCFDPDAEDMHFMLNTDGKGYDAIMIPEGAYRTPFSAESLELIQISPGIHRNGTHLILKGIDIFNFSVKEVPRNVNDLLTACNVSADEIDYYVFHQANMLINESIRKKLKLPKEKVPYSLEHFGNTSSATIPLTMVTCLSSPLRTQGLSTVLSGFGVGLSWGSALIKTSELCCLPLIEV